MKNSSLRVWTHCHLISNQEARLLMHKEVDTPFSISLLIINRRGYNTMVPKPINIASISSLFQQLKPAWSFQGILHSTQQEIENSTIIPADFPTLKCDSPSVLKLNFEFFIKNGLSYHAAEHHLFKNICQPTHIQLQVTLKATNLTYID